MKYDNIIFQVFEDQEIKELRAFISLFDSLIVIRENNQIEPNYTSYINSLIDTSEFNGYYTMAALRIDDKNYHSLINSLDSSIFSKIWYPIEFKDCHTWELAINSKLSNYLEEISKENNQVEWILSELKYGGLKYGNPDDLYRFKEMDLSNINLRLLFVLYQFTWRMQFECIDN